MYYADSMAFLALQGQPPVFDSAKKPQLNLAHLTSVPPFVKDFDAALAAHKQFRVTAIGNPGTYRIMSADDFDKPEIDKMLCIVFGLQHAPDRLAYHRVYKLAQEGVRFMTLAYDEASAYGGGFLSEAGLTDRGKALLEWMAECGMILDLSHANHKTAREALEFIDRERLLLPVAATHTGCYSVFPHPRNLPDDVLQGIGRLNGYVGINLINFFLTPKKDGAHVDQYPHEFNRHLTRAMNLGINVGTGSDCPHVSMTMLQAEAHFHRMVSMLKTNGKFGEYFPDRPQECIEHGEEMFEVLSTKHPCYLYLLYGLDPIMCDDVYGSNFRSFLQRSLPQE